ncbi:MAG: DUF4982 domain-containing protein [Planctomycetes bacterium]|nr:DUF4982 domain-containing protein [Planctomycetota bacterium]
MRASFLLFFLVSLFAPGAQAAETPPRQRLLLDAGWRFHRGEVSGTSDPAAPDYDDHEWRTVHLPHDFLIEGKFSSQADARHGSLPTTTGWYRLTFDLPASDQGKSLWIDFDGVYRDSQVWLNGQSLGRHASGYTSFRFDITSQAHYGGRNVLAVHVDPTHFEGWWYEGGGIYRHLWLDVADPVHLAPWSTFVSSQLPEPGPSGKAKEAVLTITTTITNTTQKEATCTLFQDVRDPDGQRLAMLADPVKVPAGQSLVKTHMVPLDTPRLWSLETPHLYRLISTIHRDGKVVDGEETPFGIRTIRFDPNQGFFLNGKLVKIQGTCNHQDFIGVGIAVPDSLEFWRVRKLQEMGANAWRMSHNPPTPALLDACDQLGMLVMDENRHLGDSEENLAEVANMVQRDRNHPSIIMWSMCNEEPLEGTEKGAQIFTHMRDVVRRYDTTRPVTTAMHRAPTTWGKGFSLVEDLQGCNYGSGADYDRFHRAFPKQPMFGSETASTKTTRGEYADNKEKVFVSSYNLTDRSWSQVADRPWMGGSFVWTGFDYKGEPTPYQWPCINSHFGILDMCGFPKDNYYYYLSWWKTAPIVHLMPHWNWPGKEGQNMRVIAFSNCAKVELFLNGKSLGIQDMPRNGHLEWTVRYAPGTLSAKGYDAAGKVTATDTVETTGAPAALRLRTDRTKLTADGEDVTPVEVEILDAQGRVVPTADNLVTFEVTGAGRVAGVGNGNPGDHDPDQANYRHAFNGLCMVVVGAKEKPGAIQLKATAPGLKGATLDLEAVGR